MPKWTKKKLFTVRFKNRQPRALLWRKSVYKEWYEFALLAETLPTEFGDLAVYSDSRKKRITYIMLFSKYDP